MNEYDKAGRYLIKRNPPGFFRWLLRRSDVSFHAWIDTRRHALPDQGDLTNDLVAAFRVGDGFEALCVELQAASEGGSASRLLLGYVPRLLTEPAAPGSLVLDTAGGAVINLTGREQSGSIEERPSLAPRCSLVGSIEQRTLRDEDAALTVSQVAAGTISPWLLAWLPLMQGGADPGIIEAWTIEAGRVPGERDRGILAHLTLTFAALAGRRAAWQGNLEGWAVIKSSYLEELREEVRAEARVEGSLQTLRDTVSRLGRRRFDKPASRKHKAQLQAVTDVSRLERILDRLLDAASWEELLATP